jgi:outer membrane receptor protein involved in Fe transport
MGLRGIISDRNDKYLLLVNGRSINQRTHMGAINEQDMVLLGDIHHIDVVRGPGSSLYGPGAVSMVINIITYNSDTFEGTEVTVRGGAVETFCTTEVKSAHKFHDKDGGIFIYAGIGDYEGASKYDAPMVYPFTFPSQSSSMYDPSFTGPPAGTFPNEGTKAGEPMTNMDVPRDGAAARDLPPLKLHAEIKKGGWDIWARYARGGKEFTLFTSTIARLEWGAADQTWYA